MTLRSASAILPAIVAAALFSSAAPGATAASIACSCAGAGPDATDHPRRAGHLDLHRGRACYRHGFAPAYSAAFLAERSRCAAFLRPIPPRKSSSALSRLGQRLQSLARDGKLFLSVRDAIALAIENNLDVEIERYKPDPRRHRSPSRRRRRQSARHRLHHPGAAERRRRARLAAAEHDDRDQPEPHDSYRN